MKLDRTSKWVGVGRSLLVQEGSLEKIPVWRAVLVPKSPAEAAIGGYSDNGLAAGAKVGQRKVFFNTIKKCAIR